MTKEEARALIEVAPLLSTNEAQQYLQQIEVEPTPLRPLVHEALVQRMGKPT